MQSGKPNLVTRLLEPPTCRNKNTQTRPLMNSKSVSCRPHTDSVQSQTEGKLTTLKGIKKEKKLGTISIGSDPCSAILLLH